MYSPTHATVGLFVATVMPDPVSAFLAGVGTHYLLDAIPHGDTGVGDWLRAPGAVRRIIRVESIDLGLTVIIVALLLTGHPSNQWLKLIFGGLGGIIPDLLWGLRFVLDRRQWHIPLLSRFVHLHDRWHKWGHAKAAYDVPFTVGIMIQIVFLVVSLSLHL